MTFRPLLLAAMLLVPAACAPLPGPLALTHEERLTPPTLAIGDPAPPLRVSHWLRGDPVTGAEPGRVYLIDFWATWCGPCIASMPRLSRLHNQLGDRLTIIAVTTPDPGNTPATIRRHVAENAAAMPFRVAIDEGTLTADAYRRAYRQGAIPRAFLIDAAGRIAWIGHPADAEPVVRSVLAGTWDTTAAAREFADSAAKQALAYHALEDLRRAEIAGDKHAQLAAWSRICSAGPANTNWSPRYAPYQSRLQLLVELGQPAAALAAAEETLRLDDFASNPPAHAAIAATLLDSNPDRAAVIADRAQALLLANESAPKPTDEWDAWMRDGDHSDNAATLQNIARVRAAQGRYTEAAQLLRSAIERLEAYVDTSLLSRLRQELAAYESPSKH